MESLERAVIHMALMIYLYGLAVLLLCALASLLDDDGPPFLGLLWIALIWPLCFLIFIFALFTKRGFL